MNQLTIVAEVAEREVLRYTPAGIPVVSAVLRHQSEQIEAGVARKIEMELMALAVGEISGRFNQLPLAQAARFTGFLARKNRNSKSLVFHIVDFELFNI